jgi:Haem-binding domain
MKKYLSPALKILAVLLVLAQFIRPTRNQGEALTDSDIRKMAPVPDNVMQILKTACYDCHSNHTDYPWYANVQPVTWWLQNHVNHGVGELNFSIFDTYKLRRQYHKLEEISEMVSEKNMPLASYTWIHRDAVLSDAQRNTLVTWADGLRDTMKSRYPIDSLVRPKK